ncbi:MAG: hypothetical protein QNK26_14805, partial [Moritella sp.]|nr:hypothetical protein [Moritella sp.]
MNKLLLWIAICMFLPACTNWPKEGYFDDITAHTEQRVQFEQHYNYLNLHLSVANLRGAQSCTPAFAKAVDKINSRVEKAIAVADPRDINAELAILENKITVLIVNLNRATANTNCALPPRLFSANFVHPLTYQLDLLLYCGQQFEQDSAVLTELYKVCLRQASFMLLSSPKVVIEYTKYQLFENTPDPFTDEPKVNFSQDIVVHNLDTIVDVNTAATDPTTVDDDYNEAMRKYLLFDQ